MKFTEQQRAELRDAVARSRIEAERESMRLRNQARPVRLPRIVAPPPVFEPELDMREVEDLRAQCRRLRAELGKQRSLTDMWRERAYGLGWRRRSRMAA